jgi:hypothetical protein
MAGKCGCGLLGASCRADQDAVLVGQVLAKEGGDFRSLLDPLCSEFARMIGGAVFRFGMPPKDEIHQSPQYFILFIHIYRIHYLLNFNTKEWI